MVVEKEEESAEVPTSVGTRTTKDKPKSSSSSITVDPTPLDEKEESQLKEAIKKAMLDEKGQDKGYFTIGEATSIPFLLSYPTPIGLRAR
jgi:hypothetical protein